MVISTYAVKKAGLVLAPVTAVVSSKVQKYMPSFWTEKAAALAYDITGTDNKVEGAKTSFEQARDMSLLTAGSMEFAPEEGPKAPYPIRVTGRAELGNRNLAEDLDMPVFTLTGVEESTMLKLHGYYFGWARNLDTCEKDSEAWCQCIVSSIPVSSSQLTLAKISSANKRTLTIRLLNDTDETPFSNAKFEIRILGFIRPDEPTQRHTLEQGIRAGDEAAHEAAMLSSVNDIQMAQQILDHPSWPPEAGSRPGLLGKKGSSLSLAEAYSSARMAAQRQVDRVPLQKLGVRMEKDRVGDRAVWANGFYVVR
jgi:hypothetical protein